MEEKAKSKSKRYIFLGVVAIYITYFFSTPEYYGKYKLDPYKTSSSYVCIATLKESDTYFEFSENNVCHYSDNSIYNIETWGTFEIDKKKKQFICKWNSNQPPPSIIELTKNSGSFEFNIGATYYKNEK